MGNVDSNGIRTLLTPKRRLTTPEYNYSMTESEIEYIMKYLYKFHTKKLDYLDVDFKFPKDYKFLIEYPFVAFKNNIIFDKAGKENPIKLLNFIESEMKLALKNERKSILYNLFLDYNWKIRIIYNYILSNIMNNSKYDINIIQSNNERTEAFFDAKSTFDYFMKPLFTSMNKNSISFMVYTQIHGIHYDNIVFFGPLYNQFSDKNLNLK